MVIIVISLLTKKKSFKFKTNNGNANFPTQFCLGGISNGFDATDSREVPLKENVYNFSVDYSDIDKSNILTIHKYLLVKSNIKSYSDCMFLSCHVHILE